jgi:hypothetical protein
MLFTENLVISGIVARGKSIFFGPHLRHFFRKLARLQFFGAFKHHMFQHMRNTGFTTVFKIGTNFVPDLMNDHRRTVILFDYNLHTVI